MPSCGSGANLIDGAKRLQSASSRSPASRHDDICGCPRKDVRKSNAQNVVSTTFVSELMTSETWFHTVNFTRSPVVGSI